MAAHKPRMDIEQARFLNPNSFISSKLAYLNTVSFFGCWEEFESRYCRSTGDLFDSKPKLIRPCGSDMTVSRSKNPEGTMKNIKFLVKVNRGGAHAPQYVLRVDRLPIQTTTDRKLALVMGRFTAEDAVKSMQNSHCAPELVSVRVSA
jgi:hypothetical protein